MQEEHKILIVLFIALMLVSCYLNNYAAFLFFALFFGFYKIVLMNPKYESLRERFESIF